jgi:V8-like Glu-specific endopeptidase
MRRRGKHAATSRGAGHGGVPAAGHGDDPAAGTADDPATLRDADRPAAAARGTGLALRSAVWLTCIAAAMCGGYLMTPLARAVSLPARQGTPFDGTAAVGALFTVTDKGTLGRHFCTASVVSSPAENLLITAAHCLTGKSLSRVRFAPGYHDGKFPHGIWIIREMFVDKAWQDHQNPNDDVAFLIAGRAGTRVQRHTGAEILKIDQPPQVVKVIGYPDRTSRPIACTNRARSFDHGLEMVFDCDGYTNGTSGGPFLAHVSAATGDGWVIGVIGGFEHGGNTANVSYSPRFFASIQKLYIEATTVPSSG